MRRLPRLVLALTALLVPVSPSLAEAEDPVRVTLTVGTAEKGNTVSTSTYELVGWPGGPALELSSGRTVSTGTEEPRSVAFKANVEILHVAPDRYRIRAKVETAIVHAPTPQASNAPPPTGTFRSDFDIVSKPGKSVRAVSVEEPTVGKVYVDVTVDTVN